jgi:hypothetical protein
MYADLFKHNDTIDNVIEIILEKEKQNITKEIAGQTLYLNDKFFSATNLINKLKEYNEQRTA